MCGPTNRMGEVDEVKNREEQCEGDRHAEQAKKWNFYTDRSLCEPKTIGEKTDHPRHHHLPIELDGRNIHSKQLLTNKEKAKTTFESVCLMELTRWAMRPPIRRKMRPKYCRETIIVIQRFEILIPKAYEGEKWTRADLDKCTSDDKGETSTEYRSDNEDYDVSKHW